MIYALRHKESGKYMSKSKGNFLSGDYSRRLTTLEKAATWGHIQYPKGIMLKTTNPKGWEIVVFTLVEIESKQLNDLV